jgi:hypothetical protein
MAEQASKTARRSLNQIQTVRTPYHVFKRVPNGKPVRPVASFTTKDEADAFAAQMKGYVFFWKDDVSSR